jgi:hypothetical protein
VVFFKPRRRSPSYDYLIAPSASWDGTLTWGGRTPPTDPTRTTFKPAAQFGIVPFQDVSGSSGEFTIPVLAYCKGGIASVQFWCEGNTVTVTSKTKISEYSGRPFEAYKCALDLSAFPASTNGPIEVYATITPNDGSAQARVISIALYRDSGTAVKPVRYVATTGNDTTGDGTEGNPFLTIWQARQSIRTALGGSEVGGSTIYLSAGTYTYGPASPSGTGTAIERWLTIQPKSGVSRASVILNGQGSTSGLRSNKVHIKDITFDQTAFWRPDNGGGTVTTEHLWLDGTYHTGPGRTVDNTNPHGSSWSSGVYVTDAYATAFRDGWTGLLLARNCEIGTIGADGFSNSRAVVSCLIDEVDNTGTAFHPDIYQITENGIENAVVYGLIGKTTISVQGVFSNGNDVGGNIRDIAIVNSIVQCNGNNQWSDQNVSHWVCWNNNFRTGGWGVRDNDVVQDNTFAHFDLQQNLFAEFSTTGANPAAAIAAGTASYNHFESGSTFGTNASTGTADVDGSDTPTSSQLRPSGTSQLTVCDIWGNTRPSTGTAIGPVEAAAP